MSLTTYNFFWGIIELILPRYLERRQKKGKEDLIEGSFLVVLFNTSSKREIRVISL